MSSRFFIKWSRSIVLLRLNALFVRLSNTLILPHGALIKKIKKIPQRLIILRWFAVGFFVTGAGLPAFSAEAKSPCQGHFVNPVTDICWSCLFPLSIGDAVVVSGDNPDTPNPTDPLQVCPADPLPRVGLAMGYWEPFAMTDVTRTPYCFVNLGGMQLPIPVGQTRGATESPLSSTHGAFYQVHWYKYPLIAWINLITSAGCLQGGDFDVGYLSELDPTWGDDSLSFLVNPESILFANPVAQFSCVVDAVAASRWKALDAFFWCLGAQGPGYPLSGHISDEYSVLQNATLLSERLAYRLHRLRLVEDSSGEDEAVCTPHYRPILPKSRYRYELLNPVSDANACHPFGRSSVIWQAGKLKPNDKGNYGYLIWRKRNCVVL